MNPQDRAEIGRTGLMVTRLGLGGAPLAGLYTGVASEQAANTIRRHLGHGMNFFDTAPLYGSGLSERRLGGVLSKQDRNAFVLATKVGRLLVPDPDRTSTGIWSEDLPPLKAVFDFGYDATMRCLEESLERLHLDRVDILHIHDPDDRYEEAMQGAYRAIVRLRSEGVIRAIGAGMNQAEMLARFARAGDFDCFLLAGRYTLLDHVGLRELLPLCVEKKISVIVGGPYNSGILAAGAVEGATYNYAPAPPEILERVRRIEGVCRHYGVPLKAAALQFPLAHPAIAAVIPGGRSPAEVDENVRLIQHPIPAEFWTALRTERLIPDAAPVPA
jgi:D-threo-aldose 1-dehydrogenase